MTDQQRYPLLVDLKRMQIGCALLQAAVGCQASQNPAFNLFDTSYWFLAPTPDMRVIGGTLDEFKRYAKMCADARAKESGKTD